ncbi:hypothetical protein PQY72_00675 [Pelagibacteraceae bacterium]|nr:hypothetical protein [Pelagibacteraceae bacterium]
MQKIIYSFFLILLSIIFFSIIYLSTIGVETSKFNNIIISEIKKKDPSIQLSLDKIKIKFDIKKIQIYLSTVEPQIIYQGINIPIKEINLYSKIISILKSKNEINQAIVSIDNLNVKDIQKLAIRIKPSNFKNYLLNNIDKGTVEKILIDVKLGENMKINDYKVNGFVKKVNIKAPNDLLIKDISLNFISDKNLTLINSLKAKYQGVLISNGSLSLKRNKQVDIEGKFDSKFNLNKDTLKNLFSKTDINFLEKNSLNAQGSLLHNFYLKFDENIKLIDYNYKSSGNISESQIILKDDFKSNFTENSIKKILISQTNLKINLNKKNNNLLLLEGLYNLEKTKNKKFKISYDFNKKNPKFLIDFDLAENINLELINFKSNHKNRSNIKSEINFVNNNIIFNYIKFTEGKNLISIDNLKLKNSGELVSISNIEVKTLNDNEENNSFKISFKKKISIIGNKYDATNLLKQFSSNDKSNPLKNYTKDIEIRLNNLITKSQVPLNNFILIGKIKRGKFEKISAKSEFSKTEYLDISLKKNENGQKILEIYSDLPQAILSDYKFFEGVKGGKLIYNLVFDDMSSASNLTIENFKVIKAPAFAKLLTLADLGGIADLLSGEGMRFDILEIKMSGDNNVSNVEEILALGPSLSILMEGYIEKKSTLVSLRGTLVPAKALNSLISKIPVVGGILVGDKIGEGVFGVSFKMKGVPGKIKTTVNPVKTLTPRFITRAIEKMKKDN